MDGKLRINMGAAGELLAASELLLNGYSVFRSLSPHCPCDMVCFKDPNKIMTVEVKYRNNSSTGNLSFVPDILAQCSENGVEFYKVEKNQNVDYNQKKSEELIKKWGIIWKKFDLKGEKNG